MKAALQHESYPTDRTRRSDLGKLLIVLGFVIVLEFSSPSALNTNCNTHILRQAQLNTLAPVIKHQMRSMALTNL